MFQLSLPLLVLCSYFVEVTTTATTTTLPTFDWDKLEEELLDEWNFCKVAHAKLREDPRTIVPGL